MFKTVKIMDWLYEILRVHFYWILYLLKGFIIVGIFPATAAVFAIFRQRLLKRELEPLDKLFRQYYKENFKVANIFGWLLMIVTLSVLVNFFYIPFYPVKLQMI